MKIKSIPYRIKPLVMASLIILISDNSALADETFNAHALEIGNSAMSNIDLSHFSKVGGQIPGAYRVDVYINDEQVDTLNILFLAGSKGKLIPKLNIEMLDKWGVKTSSIPNFTGMQKNKELSDLKDYIPDSEATFDFSHQLLRISIPQDNMKLSARGSVDEKYWDQGVPALLVNYGFTGSNTWQDDSDTRDDAYFLNLRSGLNFQGWRLRNYSTWNYNKSNKNDNSTFNQGSESEWDSINTYLQHDIASIKGQFTLGDTYTQSDVFDSVQFRGIQLSSDDNMLPDSLRGFAPTIRGIATSNAKVTVKQNGSVIYNTYVAPGAFTITDLYPTSASGDLVVTITEADGSKRSFTQPFSNVPMMQREDRLKYAFMVGEYRATNSYIDEPVISQATLMYGLPNDITIYGGGQISDNYKSMAFGIGSGLGILGSVSIDATQSYTDLDNIYSNRNQSKDGQSYRFQYSKNIAETDSTVTLAGYRYSTKGFYSFEEAMDLRSYSEDIPFSIKNNKRSKIQLDLTQNIMGGELGALSFSGYQQDYWNESGYERNVSLGYSNSWNGISWTLMYTYSEYSDSNDEHDQQFAFNVSVPLSNWLSNAYANYSMTNDTHGKTRNQLGINGSVLDDNNLSYSIAQAYGNRDDGYSGYASADYKGTYSEVNAGYNYNEDSHQVNYGVQGSIIGHEHGVTFGQSLSGDMSAVALVRAPGASNTKIENNTGVYTDWRGYAIVPYLNPYKRSRISLDPSTLQSNIELKENVKTVVPTAGAVVFANYETNIGSRILLTLTRKNGAIPFGATASLSGDDSNMGIVGEDGQVYLSGVPQNAKVFVKWGNGVNQRCEANLTLNPLAFTNGKAESIQNIKANCG